MTLALHFYKSALLLPTSHTSRKEITSDLQENESNIKCTEEQSLGWSWGSTFEWIEHGISRQEGRVLFSSLPMILDISFSKVFPHLSLFLPAFCCCSTHAVSPGGSEPCPGLLVFEFHIFPVCFFEVCSCHSTFFAAYYVTGAGTPVTPPGKLWA